MHSKNIKFDDVSIFIVLGIILSSFFFENGEYLILCLATFSLLFLLLQQPYKPGVFSVILIQHVAQILAAVLLSNYLGKEINARAQYSTVAIIASLGGMFFLFAPIIYLQRKLPSYTFEEFREFADKFSTNNTLYCYVVAMFIASTLGAIAFVLGNITQIIVSLIKVKWFFFLLFGFQSIAKKERRTAFLLCILFEFASGFFSFFSDFKIVIFFLVILLLTFVHTINLKNLIGAAVIFFLLCLLGLFWTSVKGDYRAFLTEGEATQSVTRSQDEAYDKLYDLSTKVDNNTLNESTVALLDRIQYTYHFAKAIETVPERIPFQNGANWLENFTYSTTPRFLNPDKKVLDNSVKTSKYTGIRYLGKEKGVSFSLGYFAESYIDFGFWGMPVFLFFIGMVYSFIYRFLMRNSSDNPIFSYAVIGSFFMEFYTYEMDGTFLLGRLFSSLLTYLILIKFFFPVILQFITKKDEA